MKKKKITYGVYGLMEYQAIVKVGKKNVPIVFTDGTASARGTVPATFTTDNVILQNSIEASGDYRRGLIKTINTIVLADDLPIIRNVPMQDVQPAAVETKQATNMEQAEHAGEKAVSEDTQEDNPSDEQDVAPVQVSFACNDDAKDYLEQTYHVTRYKLRNREDIVNAGRAYGVEIIFE